MTQSPPALEWTPSAPSHLSLCFVFSELTLLTRRKVLPYSEAWKNREVSNFPKRFSLIYLFLTVYYGTMGETYRVKTVVEFQPYWSVLKMELPLQQLPRNHTPAPLSWDHWKPGSHFQGNHSASYFSRVWQAPVPSAGCQEALTPGASLWWILCAVPGETQALVASPEQLLLMFWGAPDCLSLQKITQEPRRPS